MSGLAILIAAAVYVLVGRRIVRMSSPARSPLFGALNVAAVYLFFFWHRDVRFATLFNLMFAAYVGMVCVQYVAMRLWSRSPGKLPWLAFFVPIAFLIFIRYAPVTEMSRFISPSIHAVLVRHPEFTLGWIFVGISYLAFRTSHLVLEVRNGLAPPPGFWDYLGFAFFAPTMWVGPINPYGQHRRAFAENPQPVIPIGTSLLRVIVGAVKFRYLGPLLNQLTYSGLLLDGHPHHWIDLPIAVIVYYLYLYCNFSGFCDIAIGGAGLMGVPVVENFDNPFAARNMKEFWNRWHISLSVWMRDVVFSPLSKTLVRWFGPANANHAIALTIVIVFLLVGVWHGIGWNYAAFGAAHALGVVSTHYYTIGLKRWLGKERFLAYNRSRGMKMIAISVTFLYAAATLFLFANDFHDQKMIFTMLRAH